MNQKLNKTHTSWWLLKIRWWKVDWHRFRCKLDSDKLLFIGKFNIKIPRDTCRVLHTETNIYIKLGW